MFEDRNYLILNVNEIDKINFNDILETSIETLRYSVDETKTFIKWDRDPLSFMSELETVEGPYNHSEILDILSTKEWTSPMEEL